MTDSGAKPLNYGTTSYRRGLGAMELTAQIERYALAHAKVPRPSDDELVAVCTKAATQYLNAFKPLPEGQPDTTFWAYVEACLTWDIAIGTPLADFPQEVLNLVLAGPPTDDTPPF